MKIITERKKTTLFKKLVRYFFIIIVLMFSINIYSMHGFKSFYNGVYNMIQQLVNINSISLQLDTLYQQMENYSHNGNISYITQYRITLTDIDSKIESLKNSTNNENIYYEYEDIGNMIETFDEKSDEVIINYNSGMQSIYINQLVSELLRIKGYIRDEIYKILLYQLTDIQDYYTNSKLEMQKSENIIYITTLFITLLCAVFAFNFSKGISRPIHQLVIRLQKVAQGNLEVDKLLIKTDDEVNVLINSFNYMIIEIRNLIDKIKEKASIEKKLKEQEIKNLEIANLLNQSELNFLQTQINPHFLFNTMNSIATLADIEGADKTKEMLHSMSDILRYNLKKLNEDVTIREEYNIIKNYIYIQKVRFGNRIEYILKVDKSVLDYKVCSMILQPFVENSIVHGLEPKEGKGVMELSILDKLQYVEIIIKDNGLGMPKEKLKSILELKDLSKKETKRGIGVANVIRRLEIKYGKNVVNIKSTEGIGTEVRMILDKDMYV